MAGRRGSCKSAQAWLCRLALLAVLVQAVSAGAAVAQSESSAELEVSGGPMASVLIEIGQRYGAIVSFKPSLVERQVAPPIRGRYTLTEALTLVLRDSDLSATIMPGGAVTLHRVAPDSPAPQPSALKAGDAAMPLSEPVPEPRREAAVLNTVVVHGMAERSAGSAKPEEGLKASSSDAATLTDTPLSQLPQAVSVVTRDMLALTQAQTQIDAMGYVTGVSLQANAAPQSGIPGKIRGFPAQYTISGMPSLRGAFGVDSAVIERIEILKGPSGTVGGIADDGGRGGVINVARKRPHRGWQSEVTTSVGSQDGGTLRSTFDVGTGDDKTLWRLAGYGTRSGRTDGGYAPRYNEGLLGAITQRGDDFSATLTFQQDRRRETPPAMTRAVVPESDLDTGIANGQDSPVSKEDGTHLRFGDAELDLEWRLSRHWRLRGKGRWGHGNVDARRHEILWDAVNLNRYTTRVRENARQWSLVGDVSTGPVKHKLLFGGDAQVQRLTHSEAHAHWFLPDQFLPGRTVLPDTPDDGDPLLLVRMPQLRYTQRGMLLQDQLSIGDLQMRFAMRRSTFTEALGKTPEREVGGKSWDVGAAYRLTPWMVVYAGAQSALEASLLIGFTLSNDSSVQAGQSRQVQTGAKLDLLDDRLAVTLEAYRMEQRGTVNFDSVSGNNVYIVPGKYSKGIELELGGHISPALDLSFGFNLIRAREIQFAIFQADPYAVPATATPPLSMYLLGRYRLPNDLARDTSIGMALRARSHTWAVSPDPEGVWPSLRIPGGAQLDLSWTRQVGNGSLGVSVMNVFNRRLYGASTVSNLVPLLPRRSLSVTLAFKG